MKVFISWSGERSKLVGQVFKDYLPRIIQSCKPLFSPEIDKGTRWFSEIGKELKDTNVGIICLTRENINEPWILFEAGALSKALGSARVCPFLFDLDSTDLTGPLAQFQHTSNTRDDIYRLFKDINSWLENSLKDHDLTATIDKWWSDVKKALDSIPEVKIEAKAKSKPKRDDRELLEEMLEILRSDRFERRRAIDKGKIPIPEAEPSISRPFPYEVWVRVDRKILKDTKKFNSAVATIKTILAPFGLVRYIYSPPSKELRFSIQNEPDDQAIDKILSIDGLSPVRIIHDEI